MPLTQTHFTWTVPSGFPAAGTVRDAFVASPAFARPGNPVVLYMPTFYVSSNNTWTVPEDYDPQAGAFQQFGFYVVGLDQGNVYGSNRAELVAFLAYCHTTYGTASVARAFCRSRGGMSALNLAADNSSVFDRIIGMAPITDAAAYDTYGMAESYTGISDPTTALAAYTAGSPSIKQQNEPNLRTAALEYLPILLVSGSADEVVPYSNNTEVFQANYAGTKLRVLICAGLDHNHLTTDRMQQVIDFMVEDEPEATYMTAHVLSSYLAAAQTIPGSAITAVNMSLTIDEAGTYMCLGRLQVTYLDGVPFWIAPTKNGSLQDELQTAAGTGTVDSMPSVRTIDFAAGDVLGYSIYIAGGRVGGYPLSVNGATTFMQATKIG